MKTLALLILAAALPLMQARADNPATSVKTISDAFSPEAILATSMKVADWQLAQPTPPGKEREEKSWTYGALYTGIMALSEIAGTPKYHDAMVARGKKLNWQPGGRIYHADDQCVCQMYLELYLQEREPEMMRPTKERFDYILAHPATNELDFSTRRASDRWSWCDSLFMAPPAWARLYKATDDARYLDFMDREWHATSDYLYDQDEHLFFRDSTFFNWREKNGKKIFWSRGNGWVLAGLARVLPILPADHPHRKFYEQQFKEMAAKIASLQQADGLWRASLLDPEEYPLKETSGSGFFTFGIAWGINHGLLDRATYEPVVQKGWKGLVSCVTPEGKLEHVQPVGSDPRKFQPTHTDVYGVGAFLLAGREVYELAGGKGNSSNK
jgi:rhamnogalacturonyl hydrolase YesR